MPSSSVFLIAYARLLKLISVAKILQFRNFVAVVIEFWPVPQPAINISGLQTFNILVFLIFNSYSSANSLIDKGWIFNLSCVHLGYGFSSYWALTYLEILSLITQTFLILLFIFFSLLKSRICLLINSLKYKGKSNKFDHLKVYSAL